LNPRKPQYLSKIVTSFLISLTFNLKPVNKIFYLLALLRRVFKEKFVKLFPKETKNGYIFEAKFF